MYVFFDQSEEARVSVERDLCENRSDDVSVALIDRPFPGRSGQVGRADEIIEPAVLPCPAEGEGVSKRDDLKGQIFRANRSGDTVKLNFSKATMNLAASVEG